MNWQGPTFTVVVVLVCATLAKYIVMTAALKRHICDIPDGGRLDAAYSTQRSIDHPVGSGQIISQAIPGYNTSLPSREQRDTVRFLYV